MIVKKVSWVLLAWVVASFSIAYATDLPDMKEKGIINFAVYKNFPPYSYTESGKLVGIDVDIAKKVAEKLQLKPLIRTIGADENVEDDLRNNVWKGHYLGGGVADVMLHAPYDREYSEEVDQVKFLSPYQLESIVFAIDTKKLGKQPTVANFTYDKIGVEVDTLSDFYLLSTLGGKIRPNVVHYFSVTEAMQALQKGEVAAVMGPRGEIEGAMQKTPDHLVSMRLVTPGLSKTSWAIGMAVKQRRPQLAAAVDQAMAQLTHDGSIASIFKSYGVSYISPAAP